MLSFEWYPMDGELETTVLHFDSASAGDGPSTRESDTTILEASVETTESRPGRRLAELHMDLDTILAKLPNAVACHTAKDKSLPQYIVNIADKYAGDSSLETIFITFQCLIDLYPEAAVAVVKPADRFEAGSCEIVDCLHNVELPKDLAGPQDLVRMEPVDAALGSQLIACHLRLLDVVDGLAMCVGLCLRLKSAMPGKEEPEFQMPDLKVGSFTPSKHSAMLMQAVLMKNLLDKLQSNCKEFRTALDEASSYPIATEVPISLRALLLQAESLCQRHDRTLNHFKSIATHLIEMGLIG